MPTELKKYGIFYLALALLLANIFIFYLLWHNSQMSGLTFAVLDVGQGDALFIQSPTGTQLLFDAGPPRKILGQLSRLMPMFDRSIDAIVITNPDQDHIGGFADVLATYKVGKMFEPGTFNDSSIYRNLKETIQAKGIEEIPAQSGMRLDIGGGAVIDILFPDRDVSTWNPNDGSIIAKLTYGETSIMLTGDTTVKAEKIVLEKYSTATLDSDILKVAHHGSRSSSSVAFLQAVTPATAIVSSGRENKYGHPHQEVLDDILAAGAKILRTDLLGTIIVKCDRIQPCEIN